MLEKRTVVSQIEVTETAAIQLRVEKQVVEGRTILSRQYHRTLIEPGVNAADQMAEVNRHLVEMGCEPVAVHEIARVKRVADLEHTPEVVGAWQKLRVVHRELTEAQTAVAKAPTSQAAIERLRAAEAKAEPAYIEIVETVRRRPAA